MQAWWNGSPYWDAIIYLGGILRGCSQPNLNSGWTEAVHNQGWDYYLTWVGPQAPCTGFQYRISLDPATAFNQGQQEASAAMSAAISLGFTGVNIYYYDMEAFNIGDSACNWAVKNFVNGWVYWIRVIRGHKAGMYSTPCAISQWTGVHIGYPPDSIWAATGNGDPDVWGLECLWDGDWCCQQRLHEYTLDVWENYGGYWLQIDRNCADGPVTPHGHGISDGACITE